MLDPTLILLERLARLVHNDAHAGGLRPTQWEALRYLSRANRFSRTPGALTAYFGMTKGTVSQTLAALERKGLVAKATASGDRRSIMLDLTKAGIAHLSDDPLHELEGAIDALPKAAGETLRDGLESVMKSMLVQRGGRAFGVCRTCRHFQLKHADGAPHYCALLSEPLSQGDSEQICAEQESALA